MQHSRTRLPTALRRSVWIPGLVAWFALVWWSDARAVEILQIRHFSAPDHTRVVLDLNGPASYELRIVEDPVRLVINVAGASFVRAATANVDDGLVERIRCNPGATRAQVVLDLASATEHHHFDLGAEKGKPHRIVVDVLQPRRRSLPADIPSTAAATCRVIIDPGHGGLDPGAVRGHEQEKDIVLDVSRRLRDVLAVTPGFAAALTRDRDWYPSLADRVETAAAQDGDLFISVHCNTHRSTSVRGMEVYFLSLQGATDREAQELADDENAADLVGLAPDQRAGDAVLSILMDLHMTRVLRQSSRLSETILESAAESGIATRRVKQARFQVLRSLAMPSALVELAYLSNQEDRRLLTSAEGRQNLAEAVAAGIVAFRRGLAAGAEATVAVSDPRWTRQYKVRQGDNLWRLAQRHDTTVDAIREHNNLRTDHIRLGQYLSLPEGRPER